MTEYTLQFDGACKGNPGLSSSGCVIYKNQKVIAESGNYLGIMTNNRAEWSGVISVLLLAKELKLVNFTLEGDSLLVINQLKGIYKVSNALLKPFYEKAMDLIKEFENVTIKHIPRKENSKADSLANEVFVKNADFKRIL